MSDHDRVVKLLRGGLDIEQIAAALGTDDATVASILRNATASLPAAASSLVVQANGTDQAVRAKLDFRTNLSVTDDPSNNRTIVDAAGGSTGDTSWTTPTLGGSWATSAGAQTAGESVVMYRKDGSGFIHAVGYLDTGFAAGTPIFTFPTGSRPLKTHRFMVPTGGTVAGDASSSKAAYVTVKSDGTVNWNGEGSTFIDLSMVLFLAEQ